MIHFSWPDEKHTHAVSLKVLTYILYYLTIDHVVGIFLCKYGNPR